MTVFVTIFAHVLEYEGIKVPTNFRRLVFRGYPKKETVSR